MNDWNGFDKGVIGKKLPSDTTLHNMRKSDLIEYLHIAEHNHKILAEAYRIAVDNSKCNTCPLGQTDEQIRADERKRIIKESELNSFNIDNKLGIPVEYVRLNKAIEIARGGENEGN